MFSEPLEWSEVMNKSKMLFAVVLVMSFGQIADAQQLSNRDRLRVSVQEICPISGSKLGTHGIPLKVQVGKEQVFLCCKSCLKGKINPQHWATIHANFAKAQGKCPVMKEALPANPKWIIVQGQIVYVCCPPCTKKIVNAPEKYLRMIDDYYTTSLKNNSSSQ